MQGWVRLFAGRIVSGPGDEAAAWSEETIYLNADREVTRDNAIARDPLVGDRAHAARDRNRIGASDQCDRGPAGMELSSGGIASGLHCRQGEHELVGEATNMLKPVMPIKCGGGLVLGVDDQGKGHQL